MFSWHKYAWLYGVLFIKKVDASSNGLSTDIFGLEENRNYMLFGTNV